MSPAPAGDYENPADYSNVPAPHPEVAPPAQAHEDSTRQAVVYTLTVLILTIVVAVVFEEWGFNVLVVPVLGVLGTIVIMLRKLRAFIRWRPWMGAFWVLLPWSMIWIFTGLSQVLYRGAS